MNNKIYITASEIQTPCCDVECQETIISWSRYDKLATICTSDPTTVTRLKNIMLEDSSYKCFYYTNNIDKTTGRPINYHFECDLSCVSLRKKSIKKELSAEEKQQIVQRLNRKI